MRAVILSAVALAVLAGLGLSGTARANEPLMQGSSSVTPGDDIPTPAVDSLSDDVSPAATANTTATDTIDDPLAPSPVVGDTVPTPATAPVDKALPSAP